MHGLCAWRASAYSGGMGFDAILFDCDGVLVDSEALGLEDSAAYLRGHGFDWSPQDLVQRFTGLRDDVFAARLHAAYTERHGAPAPGDFFEGLISARRRRKDSLREVPGAQAALSAIAHRKAVASSSRAAYLISKLERTGLKAFFDPHIYSADKVAHGKPAPDIFLYAAEQLGVPPARCLVIEDSENGVRAGIAAGMPVWGFVAGGHCFEGHGARLAAAGAARIIDSFAVLVRALSESGGPHAGGTMKGGAA